MIDMQHIHHAFGDRVILHDLSLCLDYGDKTVLNAPSGFGKSTILNMIMGFIQPDQGHIMVDEMVVDEDNVQQVRSRIAYLPQNMILPDMTVRGFGQVVENFSANEHQGLDWSLFRQLIMDLDLPNNTLDAAIPKLSGGEKQRMMLALAIALKKPILLLDEALSGLDMTRATQVLEYLSTMDALSIISISHDTRHVGVGAFKALEVHRGR